MSFGKAIYKCKSCKHIFSQAPGILVWGKDQGACPVCGHLYCDWLNFDEWQKEYENENSRGRE